MSTVRFGDFSWDSRKGATNLRKHGVAFDEAATVFDDPRAIDAPDLYDAERFVLIGRSARDRILFVVHAVLAHEAIRIISARRASRAQREAYEGEASS
ncbi:MAG: BrnT family toxin [Polyangiaceae bacterium]